MTDLVISGNNCYIDCWAGRWDVQNYSVILETWMKKSDLQDLRNSIRPQAVGELYKILGRPLFFDKSWTGNNTLEIIPNANTNLDKMRGKNYLIYVRNIIDSPLPGDSGWLFCKIEGFISGSGDL